MFDEGRFEADELGVTEMDDDSEEILSTAPRGIEIGQQPLTKAPCRLQTIKRLFNAIVTICKR